MKYWWLYTGVDSEPIITRNDPRSPEWYGPFENEDAARKHADHVMNEMKKLQQSYARQ